jgi:hypothetical protein
VPKRFGIVIRVREEEYLGSKLGSVGLGMIGLQQESFMPSPAPPHSPRAFP